MGKSLVEKILASHLLSGELIPGTEIAVRVDQTLTQDATGTMAFLQFEALAKARVKTELSVSYVDHNMLQTGFENADDHRFLEDTAAKFGVWFSRPGNGICHQVHLERFSVPGKILLGADSHTPTAGGVGMLGIGAGGLDVAAAMGGAPFYLVMPAVANICLKGTLPPWVSAKDVALEVLRRLTVKGGVGKALEYTGEGVASLSIPARATIANLGTETGATTSLFPSDEVTRAFFEAQHRLEKWVPFAPDADASYQEVMEIDLGACEPLVARPPSPDHVCTVKEVGFLRVDQVVIGSCTNSALEDLLRVAQILKGKVVPPGVSLVIAPGSRQVLQMLARSGALADLIASGARILEPACGPCIGMGQAPPSGGVSLRTINRNFKGRSGTPDAEVYLVSPETAAASALRGCLTDPRELGKPPEISFPASFLVDDRLMVPPSPEPKEIRVRRGPNIKPLPANPPLPEEIQVPVLLKVGDHISTDQILPAGSKILPLRSNIPALAEYVFSSLDASFAARAKELKAKGGSIVMGGENYGQGSSREHAALAPGYLGVKAVLAKSFARIHRANLINFGILPLTFLNPEDYNRLMVGDLLSLASLPQALRQGKTLTVVNKTQGFTFQVKMDFTPREQEILIAGGLLNYLRGR